MNNKKKNKNDLSQILNKYGKAICTALVIILLCVLAYFGISNKNEKPEPKEKITITNDEKRFKEEYEQYNDIKIIEDNNIKYINLDDGADIINNGTGLIYFGYKESNLSRDAVSILINAMTSTNLEEILYVNLQENGVESDIRDTYELTSKNKATRTSEATSSKYYDILTKLDEYLPEYYLYTSNNQKVDTGEKRITAPTVVAVNNGVIVDVITVSANENDNLTEEQKNNLNNSYISIISKYLSDSCDIEATTPC